MEESAFVSGALALVLRVSRVAGIAPLRFAKQRGGWRIRPSACFSVYGCLIITGINMATIATVVGDYVAGFENAIRMQTPTRRVVWLLDACIVMALAFLGAASGPSFMRTMINCLNQLQKVNYELNITQWPKRKEMKKSILFIVWIINTILLTVADYALIGDLIRIKHQNHDTQANQNLLRVLYLFYYLCYWTMQLQIFQFMYITLHIRQSFKAVNDKLKNLSQAMAGFGKVLPKFPINKATLYQKRKKSLNTIIDSLVYDGKVKPVDNQIFRPAHETVRCLALNYVTLCDVVREVDQRYGLLLMMLLSSFMLHLILTPYYLINIAFSGSTKKSTLNIANQIMWCMFHTTKLIMLIEPCHLTTEEMYITREQISHLTRFTSHQDEPMAIELDKFFRHILLNKVSFSPLKVTTLTRGLVATILGSISTYLAIITQM